MPQVIFTGWQPPFNKISFNHLLRAKSGLGLAQAKQIVDRLLDGESSRVDVAEEETAAELAELSGQLGVHCHMVDDVAAVPSRKV